MVGVIVENKIVTSCLYDDASSARLHAGVIVNIAELDNIVACGTRQINTICIPVLELQPFDVPPGSVAKRDYGSARGAYLAVLSEDSSNEQAHAGLDALPKDTVATGTEADVLLAKGIAEYYGGDFAKAEVHIGDYISNQGGKSALAYFYLATSKLTRYFLGGDNEKKLLAEAKEDFKKAKISSAFKPPEKMVSPKILKIFEETS